MKSGRLISAMALLALAVTQPSEARIIYTPTHVKIDNPYKLHVNHNGITDFTIQQNHVHYRRCGQGPFDQDSLTVTAAQGNGEVGSQQNNTGYVAALARGVTIGSRQSFISNSGAIMAWVYSGYVPGQEGCMYFHHIEGDWVNVSNRYLGVEFQINGKTHYGWARLSVQAGYVYIHATLTGYAYEDIAGKSIKAGQTQGARDERDEEGFGAGTSVMRPIDPPQPVALGVLAVGAQGVPLWRRKESVTCVSENN
jgi:hypothetical protein